MKQEDKELLMKDLCARLPYRIKIETEYYKKATLIDLRKNISYSANKDLLVFYDISGEETPYQTEERSSIISKIKQYLFPLSSMTDEQEEEYNNLNGYELGCFPHTEEALDYLIKNHFDYRGLIPKGLAIDATNLNIY